MSGVTDNAKVAWLPRADWLKLGLRGRHPVVRRAIHRTPLVFVLVASVLGIGLGSLGWLRAPVLLHPLGFVFGSIVLLAIGLVLFRRANEYAWLAGVLFFVPFFAIRQTSLDSAYEAASILQLAHQQSEPAIIRVRVDRGAILKRHPLADSPSRRKTPQWQTQVEATVESARVGHRMERATGRVLVVVSGDASDLMPGDQIRVYGVMRQFEGPTNPGERDLRTVYRRRALHARVDVDSPEQIERLGNSFSVYRPAARVAKHSRELLLRHTSPTAGPLAIALVIGQREFVDSNTRDDLLVTGTAHLLSVSGLHLAIIVGMAKLLAVIIGVPRWFEFVGITGVAVAYVAITGGRPPVVRAAFLVGTVLIALWCSRPSQPLNTLAFAAIAILAWNPLNVSAVGVHLSFLAVATLLMCGRTNRRGNDPVDRAREREERLDQLAFGSRSKMMRVASYVLRIVGQALWFSLCVTAISMPLIWYQFHVISPISVATNVLLSPFLVVALASGISTVAFGSISQTLGDVAGNICSWCLDSMRWVIESSAAISGGHSWWPSPPVWWVVAFYLVLVVGLIGGEKYRWQRRAWIVSWAMIGFWLATIPVALEDDTLEATFVDVGHGTSVILRFGEDQVWLYDCGRLANNTGSSRDIDVALWSLGVRHLGGIFLSHADSDHYNALPGILRRFGVGQIVTPPGMINEDEAGSLEPIRRAIKRYGIDVREIAAGESLKELGLERFQLDALHPPRGGVGGNDNANSLVLSMQSGECVLMLPGDLEPPGTERLINQPRPKPGSVLMAPHHGSLTMNAEAVLQWARPAAVPVSGGRRARRPEVADMLAVTGSSVHVTANVGAIRVRIDEQGRVEVREWSTSPW